MEDFAMKPLMPFLQRVVIVSRRRPCYGAVLTSLETSMQPLIGVKVPSDTCVHDTCKLNLSSTKKLEQATVRQKNERSMNAKLSHHLCSLVPSPTAPPAAKRLRSTLGVIHDKTVSGAARQRRPSIQNQSWSSFHMIMHGHLARVIQWPWTIRWCVTK